MFIGIYKDMNRPFRPGLPSLKTPGNISAAVPEQNLPLKFVLISEIRPSFRHKVSGFHFQSVQEGGTPRASRVSLLVKCRSQPNLITRLHVEP